MSFARWRRALQFLGLFYLGVIAEMTDMVVLTKPPFQFHIGASQLIVFTLRIFRCVDMRCSESRIG
eukprot:4123291-Amphidinium_carterae.1